MPLYTRIDHFEQLSTIQPVPRMCPTHAISQSSPRKNDQGALLTAGCMIVHSFELASSHGQNSEEKKNVWSEHESMICLRWHRLFKYKYVSLSPNLSCRFSREHEEKGKVVLPMHDEKMLHVNLFFCTAMLVQLWLKLQTVIATSVFSSASTVLPLKLTDTNWELCGKNASVLSLLSQMYETASPQCTEIHLCSKACTSFTRREQLEKDKSTFLVCSK